MSDKEILTKAVQKAIDHGWGVIGSAMEKYCPVCDSPAEGTVNGFVSTRSKFCGEHGAKIEERMVEGHWRVKEYEENIINGDKHLCISYHTGEWFSPDARSDNIPAYELIFNHEFAKILWGEDKYKNHLQKMVLFNNPIQYLGQNV